MSRITEIETIIDNLGGDATAEELALALRGFAKRDIQAVLASRSGDAEAFNGGTITEPLEINTAVTSPLIVDGPPSGDSDDLFFLRADGSQVFHAFTDGAAQWTIREDGKVFSFERSSGANSGSILRVSEYDVRVVNSAGAIMLRLNRESGGQIGFFGAAPVSKPTGVAVTAAGIHAALVSLGLIAGP